MTKANTYTIHVQCDNCDFYGEVSLPKGTPAAHSIECPNCGCKTAHKPSVKHIPLPRLPYPPPIPKDKPRIDDWFPKEPKPDRIPYISTSPAPRQVLEKKEYYSDDPLNYVDTSWLIPVIL